MLYVGSVGTPSLDRESRAELERFSARWSVRFSPIAAGAASGLSPSAENPAQDAAERVEALFDAAQTALGALRPEEVGRSLSEAERLIQAHPELPQATWLLAECNLLTAEWLMLRDPVAAAARRAHGLALEGPRATPFREGRHSDLATGPATRTTLRVRGLAEGDILEWDAEVRSSPLSTPLGQHQLRVRRGERLLWASWVTITTESQELTLNLPRLAACSADDVGATRDGPLGPIAPLHAACSEWAVARASRGELQVALCRGSRCGHWHRAGPEPEPFRGPAQLVSRAQFPRWAAYTLASAGTAAVAAAVLFGSGVLDANSSRRERWTYDGLR